ncbi:MAG: saccharopine dehydrogenase NADP-binding domain-containing protein, partial [Thermoplasmata archaeon]
MPRCASGRTTKVFAVGGAGRIGRSSAKLLAGNEIVSEIAIAGRDLPLSKRIAAEIGPKATAIEVDATDERRLAS